MLRRDLIVFLMLLFIFLGKGKIYTRKLYSYAERELVCLFFA